MKNHLHITITLFILVTALALAANFIPWDETPLEHSLFGLFFGLGAYFQSPFFRIVGWWVGDRIDWFNYELAWKVIPFLAGLFWSAVYYGLTRIISKRD